MLQKDTINRQTLMRIMVWLGGAAAVATVAMRVWLLPSLRDWQTGLYTPHYLVIGGLLLVLAALGVLGMLADGERREIAGLSAGVTAVALLVTGVALGLTEVLSFGPAMVALRDAGGAQQMLLSPVMAVLQSVFGVAGGIALVVLGLRLLSEGVSRRGIAQWSVLLPVVWTWLRLVNYEISYASMVRLKDSFFGLLMLILELLFVFKLARYVAGVGKSCPGRLMFYSMATAVFSLSAPVTRWLMYLLGDSEAYSAHHLAGPVDCAIGVLALVFGIALLRATADEVIQSEDPDAPMPGMVDSAGLVTSTPEEEEEPEEA